MHTPNTRQAPPFAATVAHLSDNGLLTVSTAGAHKNDFADGVRTERYLNLDRAGTDRLASLLCVSPEQLETRLSPALGKSDAFDRFRGFCDRYGISYEYGDFSD